MSLKAISQIPHFFNHSNRLKNGNSNGCPRNLTWVEPTHPKSKVVGGGENPLNQITH